MAINPTVTKDQFTKRLADLCLKSGLLDLPKDLADQHILLKSAILMVGQPGTSLSEKEINAKLELWILEVCNIQNVDHITMRRRLVDTGYLTRSKDGATYLVSQPGLRTVLFDEAVDHLDIPQVIVSARDEMARRKKEYLERSQR
jgi:hypothetical protein